MTDHAPDTMSGYETTITLTLRSIGRYRSAESAREHTAELLATGQLADQEWAHSVTVTPLTADASPEDAAETGTDIRNAQTRAWANKVAKGFNTTDIPLEFGLLYEEIGEAFSAWRKGRPDLGGELADVAIFLLGLAEMARVDLAAEIRAKLAVNEARAYVRLPNGTPVKAEAGNG